MLTELLAPIFDVRGPRLRVDWRVNAWLLLYASYAFFEDRSVPTSPLQFHDPYGGAELRWNAGSRTSSRRAATGSSGTRRCTPSISTSATSSGTSRSELPHGLSIETQGFVLLRRRAALDWCRRGPRATPTWRSSGRRTSSPRSATSGRRGSRRRRRSTIFNGCAAVEHHHRVVDPPVRRRHARRAQVHLRRLPRLSAVHRGAPRAGASIVNLRMRISSFAVRRGPEKRSTAASCRRREPRTCPSLRNARRAPR